MAITSHALFIDLGSASPIKDAALLIGHRVPSGFDVRQHVGIFGGPKYRAVYERAADHELHCSACGILAEEFKSLDLDALKRDLSLSYRAARGGEDPSLDPRGAIKMGGEVRSEFVHVILRAMDEARLPSPQDGQSDRIQPWRIDDSAIVPQVSLAIDHGNIEPAVVRVKSRGPHDGADLTSPEVQVQP